MILAVADDSTIGHAGSIPWRIPSDLRRFKEATMGRAVIMGRKTWDSLPDAVRHLPGRRNIVLTRDADKRFDGATDLHSLDAALHWCRYCIGREPFVIGSASLYREALPMTTRILLTEVHCSPAGDTRIDLDRTGFRETSRMDYSRTDDAPGYSFVTLERATM
jgi:dihydrofolate reductase